MDVELNAAILHLTGKYLPRGFSTIDAGATDEALAEQRRRFEAGENRPVVGNCTDATDTLFGDCEVENSFRALFVSATQDAKVREGHDHPGICGAIIYNAAVLLNDRLVEAYGDDDRTKRWRIQLNVYLVGGMIGRLLNDNKPIMPDVDDTVNRAIKESVTPVEALQAMLTCLNYAEVMLAIKDRPDLEFLPTDVRQNAPTTSTRQ